MRIKTLILENFRSYKNLTKIPFSQLTGFIGCNDAGKSTILEALDIYFEGGVVNIDPDDANKDGDPKNVRIGVLFDDLPGALILDSDTPTTLKAEHLLNIDGDIEIHKIFNCSIQNPKALIHASAMHPTAKGAADILQKKQTDLRKIIDEKNLSDNCKKTENPSMRKAIYDSIGELNIQISDVPLNAENGKKIWQSLQGYMPIFALFQSDRPSSDQDSEVQNPMKIAIEQALETLQPKLDEITNAVRKNVEETANRTLAKLQEAHPEIASELKPNFRKPSWKNIFKLDLVADDGIPLNKRGSGARRLVLLSFFQAEAERRADSLQGDVPRRKVFYAIEEPETSQHPNNQEQIINAFKGLAEAGDQVVLTTHVPALAALIPLNSLRYIDRDPANNEVRVRSGLQDSGVYRDIAKNLGVFPDLKQGIKVAVLVEGKKDIDALKSMIHVLEQASEITQFDDQHVFWAIGGGDRTLMDWVDRGYLDKLNVHQVMLQDSDRTSVHNPAPAKKMAWLQSIQQKSDTTAFLTEKRSMENYLHPNAVSRLTKGLLNFPDGTDLDYAKMADELSRILTTARKNSKATGFNYQPTDYAGNSIKKPVHQHAKLLSAHIS